jgi:uncharacterized protein (TIGR02145 family)
MKKLLLFSVCLTAFYTSAFTQDITVSFTAEDGTVTVDSVTATNLSTQESVTLPGDQTLTLTKNTTSVYDIFYKEDLVVIPNPFNNSAKLIFSTQKKELTEIKLVSISGQIITSSQKVLPAGTHEYIISAQIPGMYILSLTSGSNIKSIKLIQNGYGNLKIQETGLSPLNAPPSSERNLKSANAYNLSYSQGDIISYEMKSGNNITVVNETPSESKTIKAEFVECKDGDGNYYKIVKIGTQIWMAENIKATKYTDGTEIPLITKTTEWDTLRPNDTDKAYCWYNNDKATAITKGYGALYTYAAVTNGDNSGNNVQGVCPDGWHIPSDAEWSALKNYISNDGHNGTEGNALKSIIGWYYDGRPGNGNDSYGFSARAGGSRSFSGGLFYDSGRYGYWWTSTEDNAIAAWTRGLYYSVPTIPRICCGYRKNLGLSVRCVKN